MVYMYHSFLIHLSADGHLGCFHVLAIINSAVMNTGVHVSLSDLVSSVCMPRSGIAGSYGSSFCGLLWKVNKCLTFQHVPGLEVISWQQTINDFIFVVSYGNSNCSFLRLFWCKPFFKSHYFFFKSLFLKALSKSWETVQAKYRIRNLNMYKRFYDLHFFSMTVSARKLESSLRTN